MLGADQNDRSVCERDDGPLRCHPEPEIRGGGGGGGALSKKSFFGPSGLILVEKEVGGVGPPEPLPLIRHCIDSL